MPRYFFHVEDGISMRDAEGTVLPNLQVAREEAVRLSAALLKDHVEAFWKGDPWFMEVHDEWNAVLFTLSFIATEGSASRPSRATA